MSGTSNLHRKRQQGGGTSERCIVSAGLSDIEQAQSRYWELRGMLAKNPKL
jgi:hypothetical protein